MYFYYNMICQLFFIHFLGLEASHIQLHVFLLDNLFSMQNLKEVSFKILNAFYIGEEVDITRTNPKPIFSA